MTVTVLPKELTLIEQLKFHQANEKNYTRHVYSLWLEEQFQAYRQKLEYKNAGALMVPPQYWLSSIEEAYKLLRVSRYL